MPDTQIVERDAVIPAPPGDVYERVVDFRRWTAWSPWEGKDPGMDRQYSGADSGVGAVYSWSGNRQVGAGRMEITDVEPDRRVVLDLQFLKPFKSRNRTIISIEPEGDASRVTWRMEYPQTLMSRVMGLFVSLDKMVGPDFEQGLDNLRADVSSG